MFFNLIAPYFNGMNLKGIAIQRKIFFILFISTLEKGKICGRIGTWASYKVILIFHKKGVERAMPYSL